MRMDTHEKLVSSEIKKLIPVIGKEKAARLSRVYLLGDEDTKQKVFELVDAIKAAVFADKDMRNSILKEPPSREIAGAGDIRMGTVLYGRKGLYPINIDEKSLLTHVGIFGSSGYGKTNISYHMIRQLHMKGIPVIIFDFSKRNYKDLLTTDLRDSIDIYTVGRNAAPFRFNPLIPPEGIQLSQWIKEFSSIFDHSYWLLGGGRHVILKAMDGVFQEKKNPKLQDLKKWLAEYGESKLPTRERNWLATAERPLESLCFKETGEIFDCTAGIRPSEFFREGRITILELDALDTNDKAFFIEIMLQWIRDWLLINNKKEELMGAVILEEAHHILNRDKANKLGSETLIDLIFREVRELGLGMIYIDQHPSLVSYPALGNTSTHIYMNLGLDTKHSSDILDAGNMLGLDYDDEGNYLRRLPIGEGFMLCRHSEFPESFLVRFDKFDLRKGSVDDEDIREHMRGRLHVEEDVPDSPPVKEEDFTKSVPVEDLDESELILLRSIGSGRGAYTSQIYADTKMSGTTFKKKADRLKYLGLVDSHEGKIRKNVLNYYFLTGLGEKVFSGKFSAGKGTYSMGVDTIVDMFSEVGWKGSMDRERLTLTNEGKKLIIALEDSLDRGRILRDVSETHHFLCANEDVKNVVMQQAARYAHDTGKRVIIFISTARKFEETGSFEKIVFK